MGIRALCAAAAVVVGVGSAAEAATVDVVFTLTEAVEHYMPPWDESAWVDTPLLVYNGLAVGSTYNGTLTVEDKPFNGGIFTWATLLIDGKTIYDFIVDGDLTAFHGQSEGFIQWTTLDWDGAAGQFQYNHDILPYDTIVIGSFALAPVPLPATAALLPLGIGALAVLRRRRRLS